MTSSLTEIEEREASPPLELTPKSKRAKDAPCCEPVVYPDVEREQALRMAQIAKALGDPVRIQLVDVLRKHAGKVCVYELLPLFDLRPASSMSSAAGSGPTTTSSPAHSTSSRTGSDGETHARYRAGHE
jgi:hypothetical protein